MFPVYPWIHVPTKQQRFSVSNSVEVFFFFFFNWKVKWWHRTQEHSGVKTKLRDQRFWFPHRTDPRRILQHNVRKWWNTNQCFVPQVPPSFTNTHTHTHSETHSPNHIQNKQTGDFWFQFHPPTVTPWMLHYHANHAQNNENVFI